MSDEMDVELATSVGIGSAFVRLDGKQVPVIVIDVGDGWRAVTLRAAQELVKDLQGEIESVMRRME